MEVSVGGKGGAEGGSAIGDGDGMYGRDGAGGDVGWKGGALKGGGGGKGAIGNAVGLRGMDSRGMDGGAGKKRSEEETLTAGTGGGGGKGYSEKGSGEGALAEYLPGGEPKWKQSRIGGSPKSMQFDIDVPRMEIPIATNMGGEAAASMHGQTGMLEAMSKLFDQKLGPIVHGMSQIEQQLQKFREECKEEIWEVRCRLQDEMQVISQDWHREFNQITYRMQQMDQEMDRLRHLVGDGNFQGSSANAEKIEALEAQLRNLKLDGVSTGASNDQSKSMIVDGFPTELSQRDAEA
eukprot:1835236-Karenia_brevis.AAC.1